PMASVATGTGAGGARNSANAALTSLEARGVRVASRTASTGSADPASTSSSPAAANTGARGAAMCSTTASRAAWELHSSSQVDWLQVGRLSRDASASYEGAG